MALSACGDNASVESHLLNAKNSLSENKTNEGIIELKNALRLDSKNAEVRFLLGKVYLDLGDGASAEKELERAISLNYAPNKVIPALARAYILTESDSNVLDLAAAAQVLSGEERSHYLAYKTLAALRLGKSDLAEQSVEAAKSSDENSRYTLLASAYWSMSENKSEQAKTIVSKVLTIDPKQPEALMLLGQISIYAQEFQKAVESFTEYSVIQPRAGLVKLLIAEALLKAEQFDKAEKQADKIISAVPRQPIAHYVKAVVAFNRKDYEGTIEHAEIALSANFNQTHLSLISGASAFHLENWQQCNRYLSSILKYMPIEHPARKMLAVSQVKLGLVDEISKTLGDYKTTTAEDSAFITSLSYQLHQVGADEEAKELLIRNTVLSNNAEVKAKQGVLKLMMNDSSGIQDLENAIEINPESVELELALAYAALQAGDLNTAKNIGKKMLVHHSDKSSTLNLQAMIALKEKRFSDVEQYLSNSLVIEPNNIYTLTEQLRVAMLKKDEVLSKKRAEYLISVAPNNARVLQYYFNLHPNEVGLGQLKQAHNTEPTDLDLAILFAKGLIVLKQNKEAERLLINFIDKPLLPKKYWQTLILLHKQSGEIEKTQQTLEKWMKASPYHLEPIVLLADLHVNKKNHERALKITERGLERHQDNVVLKLIKMQLLLDSKQIMLAKSYFNEISRLTIDEALKKGIKGRIYLLEELYEKAIPELKVQYDAYPSAPNSILLAKAYIGNNEKNNAIEVLKNLLQKEPDNGRVKTMLAGLYIENSTEEAINTYSEIVEKNPKNFIAHNNLAWLYLENKSTDQALSHAKLAFNLRPDVANVVDTYSQVLLAKGEKREALKYATKALEISKGQSADIELNYADALIANKRLNEARKVLQSINVANQEQKAKKIKLEKQI